VSTGHHSVSKNAGCNNLRKRRAFTVVGTGQGGGMNRQTEENLEFRLPRDVWDLLLRHQYNSLFVPFHESSAMMKF